ncbi:hypothetical protein [Leptospira weilii]|uniref:hypothetical protein n=1 Tax=Leptospira weilii TaxID=28184 RepID=UPI0002BF7F85|nr:hypothetical protein [Leptospira weilii]EMN45413.1 hypothetical protein LEP1GSC086_3727 [Leptospira weilii str. LNT 1234]QDK23393.1 hypothetical protein FHG67_12185 [Leptospira weilii]QDK26965.1 hypothetical protein FHG68_10060 [Leptospira weilii]
MSYLDEIITEELSKLFGIVKNRFQREFEKGIQNVSSELQTYITQGDKHNESEIFEFMLCEQCERYHFENEKHVCNMLRGKRNA